MKPFRRHVVSLAYLFLSATALLVAVSPSRSGPDDKEPAKAPPPPPGAVEVRLSDDSVLKLTLREPQIEVQTRFGKLSIPVAELQKIEFGMRVPEEVQKKVTAAIADLGSPDYKKREAATAELLALKERAYRPLQEAMRDKDAEVARRARELVDKVRQAVPEERLSARTDDIVHTSDDSRIVCRVLTSAFKVSTSQFGEQQLKLADVRSLRSLAFEEKVAEGPGLPDPGSLYQYQGQVGKKLTFRVTGGQAPGVPGAVILGGLPGGGVIMGGGNVWGTDMYTLDSTLALAAVHAGILKPGQVGNVKVEILGPQNAFTGSVRNGVSSMGYGAYPGAYKFVK